MSILKNFIVHVMHILYYGFIFYCVRFAKPEQWWYFIWVGSLIKYAEDKLDIIQKRTESLMTDEIQSVKFRQLECYLRIIETKILELKLLYKKIIK